MSTPRVHDRRDTKTITWRSWSCTVRVTVQTRDAGDVDTAALAVRRLMRDVERSADRFDLGSDISRINASAGRLIPVRPLTMELVRVALDAARETGGLCDPTIGSALVAAGYDTDIESVRARVAHQVPVVPALGWRSVRVDDRFGLVGVHPSGHLDLGATAKAWTADHAAGRAAALIGRPVLVSIGGDLAVAGEGRPWSVNVSEFEGDEGEQVTLTHGALTTSSTRGRRWRTQFGEAHHVIDPRTGTSAGGPWRTCSVWAPSAVAANAASTAALVLGDDALGWLADRGYVARLVDLDGAVTHEGDWPRPEERVA